MISQVNVMTFSGVVDKFTLMSNSWNAENAGLAMQDWTMQDRTMTGCTMTDGFCRLPVKQHKSFAYSKLFTVKFLCIFVQQLTKFQLTQSVARSLCAS